MHWPDTIGIRLGLLRVLMAARLPVGWATRYLSPGTVGCRFRIGRGSCLLGRDVQVGHGVNIGKGTDITAETIILGDDVTIGAGVTIRTKKLIMGKGSRIDGHTTVYGVATSRSSLEMGEFSWIYSNCHINTDDVVSIGDRSAAGSHCLIFTHSSYLPITQGYPVTFAPVSIGSDVWLPWHAFILPGAKIGSGSTVGAFSLVAGEVPANSLAVGVPAKVVKDADTYRRKYSDEQMVALCERISREVLDQTIGTFRPKTLFFPEWRKGSEVGPGCWELSDSTGLVRVVLVPRVGDRLEAYLQANVPTLFVTCGEEQPIRPDHHWCDLVTQRSARPRPLPVLLEEFKSEYSRFGIRFAWHLNDQGASCLSRESGK